MLSTEFPYVTFN